ncbi:DUF6875 domain-containing protein [Nocardia brasiliensis]|uniref:DUF6875 domain-containing protein n=1 Tax=Nocardia brasiliensis TaxID=37326 RepID=UPI001892F406|nr:hypothetical protein [Nocardia brasiliensis]MBF6124017.1 hypothetical protein [Nocardia brasiliensis]
MSQGSRVGPRTGLEWCNVYDDPAAWAERNPHADKLLRYLADRLARPDPALGRDGPVCPFVRHTMTHHSLWVAVVPGAQPAVDTMTAAVDDAFEIYCGLRDAAGRDAGMLAAITLFPDLTRYGPVDAVHQARKTAVVAEGLMLGQFYPGCGVSGLWNKDFRPLDAPLPMLVIRKMMNTDFPFLVERTEWLYAYLTQVAPDLPRRLRWSIAERLQRTGVADGGITDLRVHSPGEHAR